MARFFHRFFKPKWEFVLNDDDDLAFLAQDYRPRAQMKINNYPALGFVEPGSPVSAMNDRMAEIMGLVIKPSRKVLCGEGGIRLQVLGSTTVQVEIDGNIFVEKFIVIKNLSTNFLLGMSFCKNFSGIRIKHGNKTISLKKAKQGIIEIIG